MVNFVWVSSDSKDIKLKNLLIVWIFIGFISILFHFTVVFFFWLVLKSIILVWIFLAFWNLVSLLFDIPFWVLQKYINSKTFMIIGWIMVFLAILIFFKFVFIDWIWVEMWTPEEPANWFTMFTEKFLNFILLLLAATFYGLISEAFWVTSFAYILDNCSPSEYAKYLSRYNIFSWGGRMLWLIFSWILLAMNIKIALIIFIILTIFFILFVIVYFDNWKDTIRFEDIKNVKFESFKIDLWKAQKKISKMITKENLVELTKDTKVIFLKPLEIKNSIDFKEVYDYTILNFKRFFNIIFKMPRNLMMFWIFFILMQFSFWDTFVSTFLIDFLQKLLEDPENPFSNMEFVTWYVLLWVIALPAFVFQDMFIKLWKKVWNFKILMFWAILSWVSLFLFGFFASKLAMILILGLLNSVWYAAVMWVWQWLFSERYNVLYAVKNNLKQIDSTVSAAPLKIVLNLANVVWLLTGSAIVSIIWYRWFFFIFGGLLIWLFVYSILNYKAINEAWKEWEWMFWWESKESEIEEFDWQVFNW